jgi:hypothetical protein
MRTQSEYAGARIMHVQRKIRTYVDREASLEEGRHREEQFQCHLWCLDRRLRFSQAFAPQT